MIPAVPSPLLLKINRPQNNPKVSISHPSVRIDSDIIISSLLSEKGASYVLMQDPRTRRYVSSIGIREQIEVVKRLSLSLPTYHALIKSNFQTIDLGSSKTHRFEKFVTDKDDAHIVQGAAESSVRFIITYNNKHFKIDLIKQSFDIVLFTPGLFLQYLRSR